MIKERYFGLLGMTIEKEIILGSLLFFLFSVLDGALTLWGLRLGVIEEVNPLMKWLIYKNSIVFMVFKLSIPVMLAFVLWKIRNRSRKFVACSMGLVLMVYSIVMVFHVYWITGVSPRLH
ncbi:hypothetical protein SAMN05443529_11351 [Desulfosporosinus hippei DSM 8344]|uniref:DUF5658 domain-containing protein n=2 Tax=Desulfosporosinus TaxID=79206 RepID=A0A1G8CB28_9FIRM|nr:hypothetical protein SAMN05443529_11351 [Desulfosporosinus hippei DSM 8344]